MGLRIGMYPDDEIAVGINIHLDPTGQSRVTSNLNDIRRSTGGEENHSRQRWITLRSRARLKTPKEWLLDSVRHLRWVPGPYPVVDDPNVLGGKPHELLAWCPEERSFPPNSWNGLLRIRVPQEVIVNAGLENLWLYFFEDFTLRVFHFLGMAEVLVSFELHFISRLEDFRGEMLYKIISWREMANIPDVGSLFKRITEEEISEPHEEYG